MLQKAFDGCTCWEKNQNLSFFDNHCLFLYQNKRMKYLLPALSLAFLLVSCGDAKREAASTTTDSTPSDVITVAAEGTSYPSISQEAMNMLYEKCDHIDYVFLTTDYSISTNSVEESRPMLRMISTAPAKALPNCQMLASVTYIGAGDILMDANMYFGEDQCCYLLFLENNQPKYGNYLTSEGVAYFNKLFASVQVQTK